MDLNTIIEFVKFIVSDGKVGIIVLLMISVVGLIWERKRMIRLIEKKDRQVERILMDYHKGNSKIVEALNNLKILLVEIKGRII